MRADSKMTLPLVFLFIGAAAPVALAQGIAGIAKPAIADVALDNLSIKGKDGGTVAIKSVVATATNLSKDELAKLFNPDTPKDVATAIVAKMKADKVSIPAIDVTDKESTLGFHDLKITGVNEGKVDGFAMSGFDGKVSSKDSGEVALKSGPLELKNLNLSRLMAGVSSGNFGDAAPRIGSISWKGFEASFPDKDTPASAPGGNLIKVSLASLTGENTYDGDIPVKGAGKGEHLVVVLPKGSTGAQQLAQFGVDKIDIGISASGSYDKAKKSFALDDYTITGVDAGAIGLKGSVGGVDPAVFSGDSQSRVAKLMGADISNIALSYKDNGLFSKVVAYFADQQKKTVADVKTEWSAMATQFLPLILGGDPSSLKIAAAVSDFITAPKSLTITAKAKAAPVKVTDLMMLSDPKALLSKIDLDAVSGK